jgi:hypothetical protein
MCSSSATIVAVFHIFNLGADTIDPGQVKRPKPKHPHQASSSFKKTVPLVQLLAISALCHVLSQSFVSYTLQHMLAVSLYATIAYILV